MCCRYRLTHKYVQQRGHVRVHRGGSKGQKGSWALPSCLPGLSATPPAQPFHQRIPPRILAACQVPDLHDPPASGPLSHPRLPVGLSATPA